jgi:hypothetical protein
MSTTKKTLLDKFEKIQAEEKDDNTLLRRFAEIFEKECPADIPGSEAVELAAKRFSLEEIPEILSEVILTVTANCSRDDFHNWDYVHLEYIIDLSNKYDFKIPKNFLNGLPEQLILTVQSDHLESPPCEDEE